MFQDVDGNERRHWPSVPSNDCSCAVLSRIQQVRELITGLFGPFANDVIMHNRTVQCCTVPVNPVKAPQITLS